jgi:hypothetical protein
MTTISALEQQQQQQQQSQQVTNKSISSNSNSTRSTKSGMHRTQTTSTTENNNCLLTKDKTNLFGDDKKMIGDNGAGEITTNELSDHIQFLITEVSGPKTVNDSNVEEKEPPDNFELVATGKSICCATSRISFIPW